jgi:hypothetical protein
MAATQVWIFDDHPGYRRAMESSGTVAAPLLAGFSFTLLVLLLPTLGTSGSAVQIGGTRGASTSEPFSAMPDVAAVLILIAGLLLIACVQAAITARYFGHAPADLEGLFPEYFPEATRDSTEPPEEATALPGWEEDGWPALRAGTKWHAGWIRRYFYEEVWQASRWAVATRTLYHFGILALVLGLTALVTPPAGAGGFWRWTLFGVATLGALGEAGWILANSRIWAAFRGWICRSANTAPPDFSPPPPDFSPPPTSG